MRIIIPMTGYGSRFVAAGYRELKPFIPVLGEPIISWIAKKMYGPQEDYLFVCRQEHLDMIPGMWDTLKKITPHAEIAAIDDWVKKGPVYDIMRVSDRIADDDPCIINYCDFYMTWDWERFKCDVQARNCDGCIPCYTGFHPHLLPKKNLYASCRTDESDNLLEIREKYSFSADKTQGRHSPGVYYFKTGALLKKYCQRLIDENVTLNGEFYASLPYRFMVQDGLQVWVPTNVTYFCQWGTPEDMAEFNYWMDIMRRIKG